jgi:hypothetical protein
MAETATEICVFISNRVSTCDECKRELGRHAWIFLAENSEAGERRALCLSCADLDHLDFLPSGNTALTRRAKKHSALSDVVLEWSRSRKRYERQGLLVSPEALAQAEAECLADSEVREKQRARAAVTRESEDRRFIGKFAERTSELYPSMPEGRAAVIAAHACQKYSGRVGRSSSAKDLDEDAIRLAVAAHVRHAETEYDALLMGGVDRQNARSQIRPKLDSVLATWTGRR